MVGTTLVNRYTLEAELGRGGMGVVYRAQDKLLNRAVAIKVISALNQKSKAYLLSEAQLVAKLNHPHIVTLYDVGEAKGIPFIVMELVAGTSLHGMAAASLSQTVVMAQQICAALEHAHTHGVIHRDLKAENILLTPEQNVKLADFGLARSLKDPHFAQTETFGGTFAYMAPEMFMGQLASEASDLYALGVLLYEMATGCLPFTGDSLAAIMKQHLDTPPTPPKTITPEIPPMLDALILRLLSKRPEDRPTSAAEVRRTLEQLAHAAAIALPSLDAPTSQAPKFTVLLVDDDPFNREGIRLYLRQSGISAIEAGDEETAWQMAQTPQLAAAVVDISIPPDPKSPSRASHNYGVRLASRLKQTYPALGVVLFSAYEDRGAEVFNMVQEGVRGLAYKLKGCAPSALLGAINEVIAGRIVIDPEVHTNRRGFADELLKRLLPDERTWVDVAVKNFDTLTLREKELAQRLAASHNTEGIAAALSITPKTTENYIGHVYDKLGLNEMTHAAPHLRKVVILAKACMVRDLSTEA